MTKEEFRQARLVLNLTRARMAEDLRLSERQVIRYEHGDQSVPGPVEIAMKHFLMMANKVG